MSEGVNAPATFPSGPRPFPPGYKHHPLWYRVQKRLVRATLRPYWKQKFASFGAHAWIDLPTYIVGHRSISIGDHARVWRHVRLDALNVRRGAVRIAIGPDTGIQPYVHIGAGESVRIGRRCRLAQGVYITDHDHDYSHLEDPESLGTAINIAPVSIGDYVWLGERVIVLKGVTIGDMTVVGAGSVVTRSLPSKVMAVGSPAKVIRVWDDNARAWVKTDDR